MPAFDAKSLLVKYKDKPSELKKQLSSLPSQEKGKAFELFICELYRGNGYITKRIGGTNDKGADVLIYLPNKLESPFKILQVKNTSTKLTYDNVRTELRKFEEEASIEYGCYSYELISISGFVSKANRYSRINQLERYNITLLAWDELVELIETYSPLHTTRPTLRLHGYNQTTYRNIRHELETQTKVSCVQATGTGKRYLTGQLILDYAHKKICFLSPSTFINEQQKKLTDHKNVTFGTYQGLKRLLDDDLHFDLIIVDEFHRLGAKEWGKKFRMLLRRNQSAKLVGFTATPERHLDNGVDMRSILFNDVCVNDMRLEDAIARRILPSPTYVTSFVSLDRLQSQAADLSKTPDERKLALKKIKSQWDNIKGAENVIAKHAPSVHGKYVVFCENIDHLNEMIETVRKWIRKAGIIRGEKHLTINDFTLSHLNSRKTNQNIIKSFSTPIAGSEVRILFAIDMLNEGIHIDDVCRSIFLRKTQSLNVFMQQLGRVFHNGCSQAEAPLIFDFVENAETVSNTSFSTKLTEANNREKATRRKLNLPSLPEQELTIHDNTSCIRSILHNLSRKNEKSEKLSDDEFIENLERFIKQYGHKPIPVATGSEPWIEATGAKLKSVRASLRRGSEQYVHLTPDLKRLNVFIGHKEGIPDHWLRKSEIVEQFIRKNGHCTISKSEHSKEFPHIGRWAYRQKQAKLKGLLSQAQIEHLNAINFVWGKNRVNLSMEERISDLKEYINTNGGFIKKSAATKLDPNLGDWAKNKRNQHSRGTLGKETELALNEIGFLWVKP